MRSPYSTIPRVTITTRADGHHVTCDACPFAEVRQWRATADVIAWEHVASHGTPIGEQD
jgi:hypothetical protein